MCASGAASTAGAQASGHAKRRNSDLPGCMRARDARKPRVRSASEPTHALQNARPGAGHLGSWYGPDEGRGPHTS